MKILLFVLLCSAVSASDARIFLWQESRDAEGRSQFSFYVGSRMAEVMMTSDEDLSGSEDQWAYGIVLRGESTRYSKDEVAVFQVDGHELVEVHSGTVAVDWKKREIVINLHIVASGRIGEFRGNGRFPMKSRSRKGQKEKAKRVRLEKAKRVRLRVLMYPSEGWMCRTKFAS